MSRRTLLVGNINHNLRAAGEKIDICPQGDCGDNCKYNAIPGEILLLDMEKRETISVAEIPTVKKLAIAQAIGSNGCASDLRYLFRPDFNLCDHTFDVEVESPNCGQQQILDIWLPNCTPTDTTMGFGIELDDHLVRMTHGFNQKLLYNWVVDNYKGGCEECDPQAVCEELVCKLVDKINGKVQTDPTKVSHHPGAGSLCDKYQPFRAQRLFPGEKTRKIFCLNVEDVQCEGCLYIPAITGIEIDGVAVPFTFTINPANDAQSMIGQLPRIINQINAALEEKGGGAANLIDSTNGCCPKSIMINTCLASINLLGAGGAPIAPCEELDVKATDKSTVICRDCTDVPAPEELRCGLTIILDPVKVPCNCAWPDNFPPPNTYVRSIQPMLLGDEGNNHLVIEEFQPAIRPTGLGYFYQSMERFQSNGGPGGDKMYQNYNQGLYFQTPSEGSRDHGLSVICPDEYCAYSFGINFSALSGKSNGVEIHNKDRGVVLINKKAPLLQVDWEAVLLALQDRGICSDIKHECK